MWRVIVMLGATACFNPKYNNPTCGPQRECPEGMTCVGNVCQRPYDGGPDDTAAPVDVVSIDAPSCPSGYIPKSGAPNLYKMTVALANWANAQAACVADGAYLLIPDSMAENQAFEMIGGYHWIGINDQAVQGQWMTVKGNTATYFSWASGQPNGDGDCVLAMQPQDAGVGVFWDDRACTQLMPYICECEP